MLLEFFGVATRKGNLSLLAEIFSRISSASTWAVLNVAHRSLMPWL